MNKNGEINVIGVILIAFIGLIVGIILFQATADGVEQATRSNTGTIAARNVTIPAGVIGTVTEVTGQELVDTLTAIQQGTAIVVPEANYTLYECKKTSDGNKGICYANVLTSNNTGVNVSYTYYPTGYIDNAGGRGMASLIPIFAALAIAIIALGPVLKSGVLEGIGK